MELRYRPEEETFRAELRQWLAAALPSLPSQPHREDWAGRRRFDCDWQRRLYDAGYAGIAWPVEFGGRGASPTEQLVFYEELSRAGAPEVGVNFVGLLHAGPTLMAEASAEQKARHLPRVLRGEEVWCQGFSEPEAGSDLASLRTRAARDGEEYVVSGQKLWTSFAHVADYCELLVRTNPDAPRHRGISWLILPMDSPGIDVRPMRTAIGSSEFAELFLDEVRVPVGNRVGEENDGWRVAMVTFSYERGVGFVSEIVESMALLEELVALARSPAVGLGVGAGRTAWDDVGLRREIGQVGAELDGLWALTKRSVSQATSAGAPGLLGSVVKLY